MKKLLLGLLSALVFNSNVLANSGNLLNCIDQDGAISRLSFNKQNQTWSNEVRDNMPAKLIGDKMYSVLEFSENQSELYTNITLEFDFNQSRLFLNYYKVDKNEITNELMFEVSIYMNKNQILDFNKISRDEEEYLYFLTLKKKFNPIKRSIANCSKPNPIDLLNEELLANLEKSSKNLKKNQLPDFYVELGYIFRKAVVDQKKCLTEFDLYSNTDRENCKKFGEKYVRVYYPTEVVASSVIPILEEAEQLYGNDPNAPSWYNRLNIELDKLNPIFGEYFSNKKRLEDIITK